MERESTIVDLFERLERERQAADRQYNEALTALDRAYQAHQADQTHQARPTGTGLPATPVFYDASQMERLNQGWKIAPEGAPSPDGSLKGRLRGLIRRALAPVLEPQQRFNASVVDHINRNVAAQEQATRASAALVDAARRELEAVTQFEWLLLQFLQTITGYVDTKDRREGRAELREQVALVQQRLVMVEREFTREAGSLRPAPAGAAPPAVFSDLGSAVYLGFEDRFRGTTGTIRERLEPYMPLFAATTDVLDIGCGRGELLELFRDNGVAARGIDANQAMVEECRSRGLAVEQADAAGYLEAQTDGSLGGIAAIQVVEHFEPAYLVRVLGLAYQKLRPGAPLVLETINAACWMAFFETYLRDLTHARPLHPDTLRYLVQASGFTSVNVEYRQRVTDADRLEQVVVSAADVATAAIAAAVNAHADKLNARLFSSMDYAVIARR
ncbi:MAG: class I SAM-dependent methyltransferase [Acidobacteria bacterium]|nr:class I SAM-dependent methyltransferase [Acidobacteriota bacterium]